MSPPLRPKVPQLGIGMDDGAGYYEETSSFISAQTSSPSPVPATPPSPKPLRKLRKRAGTLTKIACYGCRKRKCKCDGEKPVCGPCRIRGAHCDFDAVAGSEHSEEMKARIGRLEDDKRQLQGQNDCYREENLSLHARLAQLTTELDQPVFTQQRNGYERSANGVQLQQRAHGYKLSDSTVRSFTTSDDLEDDVVPNGLHTGHCAVDTTNTQLAHFLNASRHARQELLKTRVPPDCLEMPPLDVGSIFDASRLPDELS